jgi:hypothetical protein
MQKLELIVGKQGEGKTQELIESYHKHCVTPDPYNPKPSSVLSSTLKAIWISAGRKRITNVISEYVETVVKPRIVNENDGNTDDLLFVDMNHIEYNDVFDLNRLKDIIREHIKDNDCVFYIDDVDSIVSDLNILVELMNDYPNNEIGNSFDVVATITKTN